MQTGVCQAPCSTELLREVKDKETEGEILLLCDLATTAPGQWKEEYLILLRHAEGDKSSESVPLT